MRFASLIVLALGFATHGAAIAAVQAGNSPTAVATDQALRTRVAAEVIQLMDPDGIALETEVRGWEVGTRGVLNRDAGIAKLNSEHPGLIDAAIAAAKPNATEYLKGVVAVANDRKAEILARRLTIAELNEIRAFAASGVGQRFYRRLHSNADLRDITEGVLDRAEQSGTIQITEQDARITQRKAAKQAAAQTSSEDVLAIMKFERTASAKKLIQASEEAVQVILQLANNPDPDWLKKQQDIMVNAMIAFAEQPVAAGK